MRIKILVKVCYSHSFKTVLRFVFNLTPSQTHETSIKICFGAEKNLLIRLRVVIMVGFLLKRVSEMRVVMMRVSG